LFRGQLVQVTQGGRPPTLCWHFSGLFSLTAASMTDAAARCGARKGVSWSPPSLCQKGCRWLRPAGSRRPSSCGNWSSSCSRLPSSRQSKCTPLKRGSQPSRPACTSARTIPIVPPLLITRMRSGQPAPAGRAALAWRHEAPRSKPAQNVHVLPARLPRSGIAFTSTHPSRQCGMQPVHPEAWVREHTASWVPWIAVRRVDPTRWVRMRRGQRRSAYIEAACGRQRGQGARGEQP
jgi:hypothetical protein